MRCLSLLLCLVFFVCYSCETLAQDQHQFKLNTRLRVADLAEGQENGHMASGRLRFNMRNQWHDNLSSEIELDAIGTAFKEHFSDGTRFNGQPVFSDVEGVDVNQLKLVWRDQWFAISAGRQSLVWDDQRFLGEIGIWQNTQSFDSLSVQSDLLESVSINYIYIDKARRIFGADAGRTLSHNDLNFTSNMGIRPAANLGVHDHNTHLLKLDFSGFDFQNLNVMYLDIKNQDAMALSGNTVVFNYALKVKPDRYRYHLEVSAARQNSDLTDLQSTSYFKSLVGLGFHSFTLFAHYESLSGNGSNAFSTSLASGHDFLGWNDAFLTTPKRGVVDKALRLLIRKNQWKLDIRGHVFSSYTDSISYGRELDVEIFYKLSKKSNLSLRLASFQVDSNSADSFADKYRAFVSYTSQTDWLGFN